EHGKCFGERILRYGRFASGEGLAKELHVSLYVTELRDYVVWIARQLLRVLKWKEHLSLEGIRAAVPKEALAIGQIPERLCVAAGPMRADASRAYGAHAPDAYRARQLIAQTPDLAVAGHTRRGAVCGEHGIVEQRASQEALGFSR